MGRTALTRSAGCQLILKPAVDRVLRTWNRVERTGKNRLDASLWIRPLSGKVDDCEPNRNRMYETDLLWSRLNIQFLEQSANAQGDPIREVSKYLGQG